MSYYYKVKGKQADEALYVDNNETLLNMDLRNWATVRKADIWYTIY